MRKYYVVDYKGKDCIYEGYDEVEALKIQHEYNKCCGDWYLEEYDELYKMETEDGRFLIDEEIDMDYIHGI